MPKHVWIVEEHYYIDGKLIAWKPDSDKDKHCMYWKDKQSAIYAMNSNHHGHPKDLRVSKYARVDK